MTIDLRQGRWQDVLTDIEECDTLYADPPFSARTHDGFRSGNDFNRRNAISYASIDQEAVGAFVKLWKKAVKWWVVLHCDHTAWRWWEEAWSAAGFYTFQPIPWIKTDAGPRSAGDGPAIGVEYLFVARTRRWPKDRGSRPPYYMVQVDKSNMAGRIVGKKRVIDMQNVLLDYSAPEDLIVDPFMGTGTLAVACVKTGRRYVGSEVDESTFKVASRIVELERAQVTLAEPPHRWLSASKLQRAMF